MKQLPVLSIVFTLFYLSINTFSQQEIAKLRIGIFDSRCVAVAYGRSIAFMNDMDNLKNDISKAKETGDEELAKELEQQAPTQQVLMHQQVFSNGSVNNILGKIKDKLPLVAEENDIRMIISKWEIPFADDSFEYVEITDQLVMFFNPDDATIKIIDEIKAMAPMPIEKISINPME